MIPAGNFVLQERKRFCYCLFPCWISILADAVVAVLAVKNDISSNTLESFLPSSIVDVDGSLLSMFHLSAKNRKRSKKQSDDEKKLLLLLFISLSFIFFLACFFHELLWKRRKIEWNGTGNSLRREKQQQTINKITIVDEAHAAAAVAYMWSILTLISKNFLSLFTCFSQQINTFRLNWFSWIHWATNERTGKAAKSKEREERNPKPSEKAQKWIFMFLS